MRRRFRVQAKIKGPGKLRARRDSRETYGNVCVAKQDFIREQWKEKSR